MSISDRIRLKGERVLSDNYGTLKSTTFEWRRNDGAWQTRGDPLHTTLAQSAATAHPFPIPHGLGQVPPQ